MGTPAASSVRRTSAPTWGPFSTVSSTVLWSMMGCLSESGATSAAARAAVSSSLKVMVTTEVPSLAFNCGRRPLGDDPPVVDHDDVPGQPVGLLEVLGGEQHGRALGDQVLR